MTREEMEFLTQIALAVREMAPPDRQNMIDRAWQKLESSAAVPDESKESSWLVEWPISDNLPARWWHPGGGWMIDANKAIRFARKVDAEDFIANTRLVGGIVATEHVWLNP